MIHDNRFDTYRIVEILDLIFETVYTARKTLRIVGETTSLVDLANAIKAEEKGGKSKPKEEKQSIRAQLKKDAGKEKDVPKKAATKKKNNDLEV